MIYTLLNHANKLDFSTKSPCRRSKSTVQTALNTCKFVYFCISKENLYVNGLFSFHLVFYESDIYASKWFKKVQMYAEKVAARYGPNSNLVWGHHPPPPHSTLKSWQVCLYVVATL